MRSVILGLMSLVCMSAVFADAQAGKRVVGNLTVSDGSVVNFPECAEGETPGIEWSRPGDDSPIKVGEVELSAGRGTWTFHVHQAWWRDGKPLRPDQFNQIQMQASLYCKAASAGS